MIGEEDPIEVFNDVDKLRAELKATPEPAPAGARPPQRRQRSTETFARIPHGRALALGKLSGTAWLILIELDRLVLVSRRNPVRLNSRRLRAAGISRWAKARALQQLQRTGLIRIVQCERGKVPLIAHLWFPEQV